MNVRFLEAARDDLRDAVAFYEAERPGLGAELVKEVRSAVERITKLPEAWQPLSPNTRRCRTQRFPYGVIYRVMGDEILIAAVAHLHREPGYWMDRLPRP